MLVHVDLFSGIGGFALACLWNGIETILFVEIDKYCQEVLRKHWPGVPIVGDIRDVEKIKAIADSRCFGQEKCQEQTAGIKQHSEIKEIVANASGERCLAKRPEIRIPEQALQETPSGQSSRANSVSGIGRGAGTAIAESPTILVTAGFPCQPFSVAGKREGERDDRYLWPETLAVIKAVKPQWVLLENVTGIINLALDTVLSDLEGAGYSYETLIIPACAVNAWHRRDRIWIVANSEQFRWRGRDNGNEERVFGALQTEGPSSNVPDTQREGLEGADTEGHLCGAGQPGEYGQRGWQADWWAVEPELGRVAHGIPNRVDRLKCLGNAIVPQVAYEIIKMIIDVQGREG